MPSYRLERPWFDGSKLLKRGAGVELAEGAPVPSTAVRQPDPEPKAEPELDLTVPVTSLPPPPAKPVVVAKPKA